MQIDFIQVCLYFCIALNLDRDMLSSVSLYLIVFSFWAMFDNLVCAEGTEKKEKKKKSVFFLLNMKSDIFFFCVFSCLVAKLFPNV